MLATRTKTTRLTRTLPTGPHPRAIISTDQVDAERDVVDQAGLEFRERLRVTFAHNYRALPVGLVTKIARFPHRTEAEWTWFENDPDVARVRNIFEQGGLDASIGFQILESSYDSTRGGLNIKRARVVEFALVPVPANEGAMALAKALGRRAPEEIDLASIPYVDEEIDLAAIPYRAVAGADVLVSLSPHDVKAAIRATVPAMVRDALRRELARVRGRVD